MSAKVERLVNLTIAMLEARRPMTFAEIRRRTRYYDQGDGESARRMFERDKDDLRRLGVPIEVREVAYEDEVGYIVDRRAYELPPVDLDAEEVAALALAVQLTGEEGARLAFAKLAALAPDPAELDAAAPPRVQVATDPIGDDLAEAIVARTVVRFGYRTATGDAATRTLDPYAVVQRRGAWYLVGRDHDRDALRAFRLDRVEGRLRRVGEPEAFEPPADLDPRAAVSGPESTGIAVELAVAPEARWAVELRGGRPTGATHGDREVVRVDALDPVRDRSWLLGLGADVEVLAPEDLRADVARRLAAIASGHAP
ncbi:WYL domain-containing protein [Nitriliruptoraceae bacterium ZYF776]|nr:WYL domain-containing protein [Profundirhabdus halotolerans]